MATDDRYFKKPNGRIVKATPNLDIKSLESRFTECDADGKELKKEKPKEKAKSKAKKVDKVK